jgi:hypothetical protein
VGVKLWEELRQRVFWNGLLKWVFGLQMVEVTGDERKLRRMRLARHVARVEHNINAYGGVVHKPKGKRLFGKMGR